MNNILKQSSPENIIVAPKGSIFTRQGDKFFLISDGSRNRLSLPKKSFAVQYKNEIWYPTLKEETIEFETTGETWLKTNGSGKTGWTKVASKSSIATMLSPVPITTGIISTWGSSNNSYFLTSNGELWGCGYNSYGQLGLGYYSFRETSSLILNDVKIVSANCEGYFAVALKNDGTLWFAGDNDDGQFGNGESGDSGGYWVTSSLQGDITGSGAIIDVAAGGYFTALLTQDGKVWVATDYLSGIESYTFIQVAEDIKSIYAGGYHLFYIKNDDTLWGFGYNWDGELGTGDYDERTYDNPYQIDTNVKTVGGGAYHTLYIKNDGTMWGTGYASDGELGEIGLSEDYINIPIQIDSNVKSVSAGSYHTLYIKNDGKLYGMGYNGDGEIGNGQYEGVYTPEIIDTDVEYSGCGAYHSLYIKSDKSLWGMGYNYYYALGSEVYKKFFYSNDGVIWSEDGITGLNDGRIHNTIAYGDGKFIVAAHSNDSVGGHYYESSSLKYSVDGKTWNTSSFNDYPAYINGIAYDGVGKYVAVLNYIRQQNTGSENLTSTNGIDWTTGSLDGSYSDYYGPSVKLLYGVTYAGNQFVACGNYRIVTSPNGDDWTERTASYNGGILKIAYGNGKYVAATGFIDSYYYLDRSVYSQSFNNDTASFVTAGNLNAYVLKDGNLYGVGNTYQGELGIGQDYQYSSMQLFVHIDSDVKNVASCRQHVTYVKNDNTLWGTGYNEYKQLQNTDDDYIFTPIQLDTNVSQSYGGEASNTTLYIKNDGTLWGKGQNDQSQIADTSTFGSVVTESIQLDTNVKQASVGYNCIMYIKDDNTLWGRGRNYYGSLGTGDNNDRTSSVQIDTNVVSCLASGDTSYYIKTDGSLYGMGFNTDGQLGLGDNSDRNTPTQITSSGVVSIAGTYGFSQYITTGGELYSAGWNGYGQLGLGDTTSRNVHTLVPISGVSEVAAGYTFSYIIKNDGTVWSTGQDTYGQLGTGRSVYKGLHSDDAISWTSSLVPGTYYNDIAFGNGRFVMVSSDNGIAVSSTDGINWTSSFMNTSSYAPPTVNPKSIIFDGSKFVSVGTGMFSDNDLYTSNDGVSWNFSNTGQLGTWTMLGYGNGKYELFAEGVSSNVNPKLELDIFG